MSFFPTIEHLFAFISSLGSREHAIPMKTGAPEFVGKVLFANTVDLHVATTNFTNVIDEFANEVACNLIWDYSQSVNDPITEQANFFVNLNNGTLPIYNNNKGGRDPSIEKTLTVALDVILAENEQIAFDIDGVPISRLDNNLRQYKAYDAVKGTERWVYVEKDILNSVKNKTALLKSQYGFKDMDDEFKLFWINKFKKAHSKVQEETLLALSEDAKHYFQTLSDSIGTMSRYDRVVGYNLSSLDIEIRDDDFAKSNVLPLPHSPSVDDILDPIAKKERLKAIRNSEIMYRKCLRHLPKVGAISKSSHGSDLVPDKGHWERMVSASGDDKSLSQELLSEVNTTIGDISTVLHWIRASNDFNFQKIKNPVVEYAVEKSIIRVDLHRNKFLKVTSDVTNTGLLGVAT